MCVCVGLWLLLVISQCIVNCLICTNEKWKETSVIAPEKKAHSPIKNKTPYLPCVYIPIALLLLTRQCQCENETSSEIHSTLSFAPTAQMRKDEKPWHCHWLIKQNHMWDKDKTLVSPRIKNCHFVFLRPGSLIHMAFRVLPTFSLPDSVGIPILYQCIPDMDLLMSSSKHRKPITPQWKGAKKKNYVATLKSMLEHSSRSNEYIVVYWTYTSHSCG